MIANDMMLAMNNSKLHPIIDGSPLALIVVDREDTIQSANESGAHLGFAVGRKAADYFEGLSEPFVDAARFQPPATVFQMKHQARQKQLTLTVQEHEGHWYVWLKDLSETLALADQINRLKQPESRLIRQIHQAAVSGIGYSELVDVILDDDENLTKDKMTTVVQYHREVTQALGKVLELIKGDKSTASRTQADKLIVVADSHAALTELITELLRTEGYKVASFTDASSTMTYCMMNTEGIGQALIDDGLTDEKGQRIVDLLSQIGLKTIRLSEQADDRQSIQKPVDFHQLLEVIEDVRQG